MSHGTLRARRRVVSPKSRARGEAGRSSVESIGWAGKLNLVDWTLVLVVLVMPQRPQDLLRTARRFGSCALCDGSISLGSPLRNHTLTHYIGGTILWLLRSPMSRSNSPSAWCLLFRFGDSQYSSSMIPCYTSLDLDCSYRFVGRLLGFCLSLYAPHILQCDCNLLQSHK
jgi:hypothetical protein